MEKQNIKFERSSQELNFERLKEPLPFLGTKILGLLNLNAFLATGLADITDPPDH